MSGGVPHWAVRGAKVACIRGGRFSELQWQVYVDVVEKGHVYSIRDIIVSPKGTVGLRVFEVVNPPFQFDDLGYIEPAFWIGRFRPLITKTQDEDVGLFRHHLDDARVDA